MITGPGERRRRHHQKAFAKRRGFIAFELIRCHKAINPMVFRRRLQILPDGQKIHIRRAHVIHHLMHTLTILAQAHHDAGFGEQRRVKLFNLLQQAQAVEIARAGADSRIKPRHSFQIVIEHIRPRFDNLLQGSGRAFQEIRRQNLNGGAGRAVTNGANGLRKVFRPAIFQIIAVHRCDHHMFQPQFRNRMRHPARLKRVQRIRLASGDITERTAPRADFTHDHHGGMARRPAFAHIRATGLFADRHQLFLTQNVAGLLVTL
ncbi:MAG: hypothetical protein ACD_54C00924G0002 [uncultured bacterium]|nr:MAG: hypothetical protein ACD_54C00924G0002 [uncultured bacterium]